MQFGFIGVGQMGGGLARNLIRAKKSVLVFDAKTMQVALDYLKTGRSAGYGKEDCNAMFKVIQ